MSRPPHPSSNFITTTPAPGILLVLINRAEKLNSLSQEANCELDEILRTFDDDASLQVAVISGVGRAFCAGADLKGMTIVYRRIDEASRAFEEGWSRRLYEGPNLHEGLRAFSEKRAPRWRISKL
ncbi:hypothetical protein BJY01DRAFT_253715 [Aspergillus pseudoustus]|uniref:ClpP/crotonase-like domain-containing protein n=1 Tax=Aspergillus pseudoustus TaxID=1810923 RepID=A0ABR4IYH7_9EURO